MEKPDEQTLETIAENFCSNYCSVHSRFDDIQRDYFKQGFNYVWSSHVEPLQKENEELIKWKTDAEAVLIEAGKSIGILSEERDKLKSENERHKQLLQTHGYGGEIEKLQSEIDSLKEQLKQYTTPKLDVDSEEDHRFGTID